MSLGHGFSFGRGATAGAAAVIAMVLVAGDANAFCRSTTCRAQGKQQCPTDGDGCPTQGAKLWWPTSCVSYTTNKLGTQDLDPADTRAVIKKCFESWTDVTCADGTIAKMTFEDRGDVACKKSQYNKNGPNVNVVLFQDDNWNYRGVDGTLAKTSVTYNDDTGEIYDADIEVNAANNTVTITDDPRKVEYDLQAIVTHEVGHFIGIAHSPDANAVMYASYNPGSTTQRTLTDDDIGAVCEIYPPGSGVVCNTEPRGGFSATCDGPTKSGICGVGSVGEERTGMLGTMLAGVGFALFAAVRRLRLTRR